MKSVKVPPVSIPILSIRGMNIPPRGMEGKELRANSAGHESRMTPGLISCAASLT
jgi:hypothetical protein